MKKWVAVFLSGAMLVGCGSPKDPTEKNFAAALNQYLAKHGQQCLALTIKFPYDISPQWLNFGLGDMLQALQKAGLLEAADVQVPIKGLDGKPLDGSLSQKRFTVSPLGRQFYQESAGVGNYPVFCYAQLRLAKLVKWAEPFTLGSYSKTTVTYTYRLDAVTAWAKQPEIQAAFPSVKALLEGENTREIQHALVLTNQGWEARGL